jgi:hypothetical protein
MKVDGAIQLLQDCRKLTAPARPEPARPIWHIHTHFCRLELKGGKVKGLIANFSWKMTGGKGEAYRARSFCEGGWLTMMFS